MCTINFSWSRKHLQQILTLQCIPEFASGSGTLGRCKVTLPWTLSRANCHQRVILCLLVFCATAPSEALPLILYCRHTSKPFVPQQKQGLVGISLSLSSDLWTISIARQNQRSRSQMVYNRHRAVRQRLPSRMPTSHNDAYSLQTAWIWNSLFNWKCKLIVTNWFWNSAPLEK